MEGEAIPQRQLADFDKSFTRIDTQYQLYVRITREIGCSTRFWHYLQDGLLHALTFGTILETLGPYLLQPGWHRGKKELVFGTTERTPTQRLIMLEHKYYSRLPNIKESLSRSHRSV